MKTVGFLLLVCVAGAFALGNFVKDTKGLMEYIEKCSHDFGFSSTDEVAELSDDERNCLIGACTLKFVKVLNEDGSFNKEVAISKMPKPDTTDRMHVVDVVCGDYFRGEKSTFAETCAFLKCAEDNRFSESLYP